MADPPAGRQRLQPFATNVATGVHLAILTDAIEALDAAEKAGTPFEEAQAAIVAKVQGGWTAPGAPRLALTTTNAAAQAVNLGRAEVFASPEAVAKRIPAKRSGRDEDMAGAAIFLASQAGDYVVGGTLVVDGGVSLARE